MSWGGKLIHLRYSLYSSEEAGVKLHPQQQMASLGIKYTHSTPQSMGDMWQFWNCSDVPEPLPEYLSAENWNPHDWIGYGLSQEKADRIILDGRKF